MGKVPFSQRTQHRLLERFLVTPHPNIQETWLLAAFLIVTKPLLLDSSFHLPRVGSGILTHLENRVRLSYFCSQEFFAKRESCLESFCQREYSATGSTDVIIYQISKNRRLSNMLKHKNCAPLNKHYSLELFLCCWKVCVKDTHTHTHGLKNGKEPKLINSHF